jgi:hypothetical protein
MKSSGAPRAPAFVAGAFVFLAYGSALTADQSLHGMRIHWNKAALASVSNMGEVFKHWTSAELGAVLVCSSTERMNGFQN